MTMSAPVIRPIQVGVITDIQFARKPDLILEDTEDAIDTLDASLSSKLNHTTRIRRYGSVLAKAAKAVSEINASEVVATIQLGDLIDGNETLQNTREELDAVVEKLRTLKMPVLNVLGNHCLDAGRKHLIQSLDLSQTYYFRNLSPQWRLIILDTVDININREAGHPYQELARKYLNTHEGEPNAVSWGGGIGPIQIQWLKNLLVETRQQGMKAVICGHIPVLLSGKSTLNSPHLLWDPDEVISIFEEFSDVVKAYFAGHYHEGSYVQKNGIHYVVFESVLDSQSDDGAWGIVRFYDDALDIDGHGDMTSRYLQF